MSPRRSGVINKKRALEQLEVGRAGAIQINREAKINSDEYRKASAMIDAIDDLTEALTGDRTHFHTKPHNTPRRNES